MSIRTGRRSFFLPFDVTPTESDPFLALRGRVCAKLEILPNTPELRNSTDEELVFVEYYLDKREEERWNRLGKMLGVIWERNDIIVKEQSNVVPKQLFIPLLAGLKPEALDAVKKILGGQNIPDGLRDCDYAIGELGYLKPDKFKEMLHIFDKVVKDKG